eukprot:CAMPEP_0182428604 /NCGR_PEP_ID=MMETSP1167-20130531/23144_1 /TAXON_ID=2988 /ORGANISM="Mallomonas Sp, Strain CCMP3275" /LENGTH=200 /DNA_ID=CAMNT_0024611587 /DNA_START=115 /DNA_END=717 /DNA_ORIENTATION=+
MISEENSLSLNVAPASGLESSIEKLSLEPAYILDESDILSSNALTEQCSLVLTGFSPDLPQQSKENLLRQFYDKGAITHWISTNKCLVTFGSENIPRRIAKAPQPKLYRISLLKDYSGEDKDEIIQVGSELHSTLKPSRDTSVASRMIGAALGLRIPKSPCISNKDTTLYPSTLKTKTKRNDSTEITASTTVKKLDAWDD